MRKLNLRFLSQSYMPGAKEDPLRARSSPADRLSQPPGLARGRERTRCHQEGSLKERHGDFWQKHW